ncbi:MAG TPA: FadR/GntR family transcriptional regulator [Verrucomicrobiae bacterium]|jgi:GntR family transcriptional regulator, transcriptional repressor for pyruvate dehydrogenase complex|nr:FadR/GntR family transcriptional regulator [Verrucomicrobiae bacterium]
MLHAIKKTRIHEEVFSQIHELIKEGRFKARDQLPSERELAETFKVSRTSVREALRALESQGLIVSRTGTGNFVADLPVESLVGPLALLLIDEKKALADVFEMRKLIEPHIAALAAERATRNDIAQLKRIVAKQTDAVSRGATGVEADAELHFTIGRATRNQALQKLVSGLMEMLSRSREESLQTDKRRQSSIDAHRRIVAAIEKHDKARARSEMLRHIEEVEESVLSGPQPVNRASQNLT